MRNDYLKSNLCESTRKIKIIDWSLSIKPKLYNEWIIFFSEIKPFQILESHSWRKFNEGFQKIYF